MKKLASALIVLGLLSTSTAEASPSSARARRLAVHAVQPSTATGVMCIVARAANGRTMDRWYCVVWTQAPEGQECKALVIVRRWRAKIASPVACGPKVPVLGWAARRPALSPDGQTIAVATDLGDYPAKQGIYVMRAHDGAHMRRVTRLSQRGAYDLAPQFAPDGHRIVFWRTRLEQGAPVWALCVATLDGKVRRITPWASASANGAR